MRQVHVGPIRPGRRPARGDILRGRLSIPYVNASYDLSAGWPLKKPESLKTASTVFAMALMFEF